MDSAVSPRGRRENNVCDSDLSSLSALAARRAAALASAFSSALFFAACCSSYFRSASRGSGTFSYSSVGGFVSLIRTVHDSLSSRRTFDASRGRSHSDGLGL